MPVLLLALEPKRSGGRCNPLVRIVGGGECDGIFFSQDVISNPQFSNVFTTSTTPLTNSCTSFISSWALFVVPEPGGFRIQVYELDGGLTSLEG